MKAVVMAGGEGSRLRPLTANRPKPLVPIANTPIMEHILRLLKEHGVDETVVTLHYLADEIQSYFDDGSDFDMKLEYSIEDTPLGTAGSVKKAEALLRDGTFFIVSGDALTDCDLSKALAFHREKKSLATLILYRVPNPLEFGVVITDEEGRITRFLEKPSWSEVFSDTVNTGMYILEPEIFETMVEGKNYDWSRDIFPELLREGKPIFGYIMEEYWCDVGNLTQYREAQEHLLSRQTTLALDGEEVQPGVWVGPHTSIDENAMIMPPVSIGRNCKIKGTAQIGPYTSIGDNTLVEDGAVIERSVVWEGSYIGPNVNISSALVGMKCTIKRDSIIQEEAVIGDRCLVDTNCTIRPRIKLWPDKVIERGSTVTMSLVWGNKWRGNLFRDLGVAGLSNIEITPEFATRLGSAFGSLVADGSLIVTSRDSTRSSRMIKRAMMASLLSVGCEVMDMRSSPVPVTRHFIRSVGAAGAVNVRKLPGNSRVTLVELFDQRGAYLPKNQERKVETAFFREDFHRVDPDDLGMIGYASRALEEYETDFFKILGPIGEGKRLRIVCDYGFGSISSMFPQMLGRMGIETIGVNGYNDSKLAPRSKDEVARHLSNLRNIVSTLSYDFGVLFTNEGERLTIVDQRGNIVSENDLLALMATLIAQQAPGAKICLDVTAPQKLRTALEASGATIVQSKADARSLMDAAIKDTVDFAGDSNGGFIFPVLHPGFDAMFSLAKLINLLQAAHSTPHEIMAELPKFAMAYDTVRCPWEAKGGVMRLLTEKYGETDAELIDGIKVFREGGWVLILPDSFEQIFHIHAESDTADESQAMVEEFVNEISALQVGIV